MRRLARLTTAAHAAEEMTMTTPEKPITYTCRGSVRGSCGHAHRSAATALRCCQRDQAGCERQGGYSDRVVVRTDGEPLTSYDEFVLDAAESQGEY